MDKVAFCKRLSKARKQQSLNTTELGKMCDISAGFLRQIENASKLPSLPLLVRISNELRAFPNFLLMDSLKLSKTERDEVTLSRLQLLKPEQRDILESMMETMIESNYKE